MPRRPALLDSGFRRNDGWRRNDVGVEGMTLVWREWREEAGMT